MLGGRDGSADRAELIFESGFDPKQVDGCARDGRVSGPGRLVARAERETTGGRPLGPVSLVWVTGERAQAYGRVVKRLDDLSGEAAACRAADRARGRRRPSFSATTLLATSLCRRRGRRSMVCPATSWRATGCSPRPQRRSSRTSRAAARSRSSAELPASPRAGLRPTASESRCRKGPPRRQTCGRASTPAVAHPCFSNTSRSWSSSSRSKQTLLALTPEVNASRKSALVSQRGNSSSLTSVFLRLGAARTASATGGWSRCSRAGRWCSTRGGSAARRCG